MASTTTPSSSSLTFSRNVSLVAPMAFFMGMLFPLGILELGSKPHGAIAWAWSMNGLFSTIGSVLTVVASLSLGFRTALVLALAVYAASGVVFAMLRRSNQADARILATHPNAPAARLAPANATAFVGRMRESTLPVREGVNGAYRRLRRSLG